MKIKISELRVVTELLYQHLEATGHKDIFIQYDYYWNIPKESRYDVSKDLDGSECDLGQLSDDWESLKDIAQGNSPPVAYALVWLSELLKVAGEEIIA